MVNFAIFYDKDGKEHKEIVGVPRNKNTSTTRAFNEFFKKMRKKGITKKDVKVTNIYEI